MNNHFPTVSLQAYPQILTQTVQVDVLMDHIPEHFLGIAFDLVSDSGKCHYQKFERGEIFKSPDEILALALKKDEPERVVFGLSLKRGFSIEAQQGVIASFIFECEGKGEMNMHFSHGVVSVFDGQRKDLSDVLWQSSVFSVKGSQEELTSLSEQESQVQILPSVHDLSSLEVSALQLEPEISQSPFFLLPSPLVHFYLFFVIFFAIFLLIAAIWWFLRGRRKR